MSVIILRGDAAHLPLPDGSVDLIVTSPPYFGLRSYTDGGKPYDGQIGSEYTPWQYLDALWNCTADWMRVLKPGGSIFVNLGDKYSTYTGANWGNGRSLDGHRGQRKVPDGGPVNAPGVYGIPYKSLMGLPWRYALGCIGTGTALADPDVVKLLLRDVALGICTLADAEQIVDDLAMMPAPGLGLILRAEIVWAKTNGMPESAADRVRRSHEQVFHFVKDARAYYSGIDEIRLPLSAPQRKAGASAFGARDASHARTRTGIYESQNPLGAVPGSVWEITNEPLHVPGYLEVDHYAAYPTALVRRIVLGWSPSGICAECGEGRRPVTDKAREVFHGAGRHRPGAQQVLDGAAVIGFAQPDKWRTSATITGYACPCTPYADHPERRGRDFHAGTDRARQGMNDGNGGERYRRYMEELANPRGPVREFHFDRWNPAPTRPAVVVDPFGGTGTTALVADVLGRTGVTVDRSADYCRLARWRTSDPGERARALGVPKPPPVPDGQGSLFDQESA